MNRIRLGILTSHPIQYQAPLFRLLAANPAVELTVLFCHDHGVRPSFDPQFGKTIQYDVPLLDGYSYRFLHNMALRPEVSPTGQINPGIIWNLLRGEFDVLVVHGYDRATSALAVLGPHRKTRVVMRGESHLLPRRRATLRLLKQAYLRTLFARVDHFLPIGTLNQRYYESYGVSGSRMTLAPYSVDNQFFVSRSQDANRDRHSTRLRLGLPDEVPLVLFAAKLMPKKRPLDVLGAFARVRASGPCGLVYVGDGELAPQLDAAIAELNLGSQVFRLGFRNQSEMPSIYAACDVLVLPSDNEPWGLVVNEAMASGMAVVVSDHVGAGADLVEPDRIFAAGDVAALATILQRLLRNGDALKRARAADSSRIAHWGLAETADGFVAGAFAALGRNR